MQISKNVFHAGGVSLYCWVVICRIAVFFVVASSIFGADSELEPLRSTLLPMRGLEPPQVVGPRGATPQLTVAKHRLRDWLDARFGSLNQDPDQAEVQRSLNLELQNAGLICGDDAPPLACPEWFQNGYVGGVGVHRDRGFFVVTAGVGIECGYDESAYVYSWKGEKWVRVWQNEQDNYVKDKYEPQTLQSVLISPFNKENDYLVMTLGSGSWCSSNWHDVYYRVFRLGPDPQTAPLIEGSHWAPVGWRDPPIVGSLSKDDVLVEYLTPSVDGGILAREGVYHYKIRNGKAERVAPQALGPRDFVDEWIQTDWVEASKWSDAANRQALLNWRTKVDKEKNFLEYIYPTRRCLGGYGFWQVGVRVEPMPETGKRQATEAWFLVKWQPPYDFKMMAVSDQNSSNCAGKDPQADEHGPLFPIQEWR